MQEIVFLVVELVSAFNSCPQSFSHFLEKTQSGNNQFLEAGNFLNGLLVEVLAAEVVEGLFDSGQNLLDIGVLVELEDFVEVGFGGEQHFVKLIVLANMLNSVEF